MTAEQEPEHESDKDAEIVALKGALLTIANLDPGFKGVVRKYQRAIQVARIALGLELK